MQKRGNRLFISRIQRRGRGLADVKRVHRQLQARISRIVRRGEAQIAQLTEIQRFNAGIQSLRPAHGMGDRRAHIRLPKLGQHAAILIANHRVDHRLRMDQHFHLLGRGVKQPARFNIFQAFVHHRGRIDGDLAPHRPVGMTAGLIRGHRRQFSHGRLAERPTGAGQQDRRDAVPGKISVSQMLLNCLRHTLKNSVMLAIDR